MSTIDPSAADPGWPAQWLLPEGLGVGVRAVCTTREGGVSQAPYDSLNLGDHVGDEALSVQTNRQRLQQSLGVRPVFMQQVHGWSVQTLDAHSADGVAADVCLSTARDVACTIMVADCLPLLCSDAHGQVVAGAHAGWRGLAGSHGQGVVESLVAALGPWASAAQLRVWLGPCIGPTAFEVGEDVRAVFVAQDAQAVRAFVPHPRHAGKWLADLPALTRQRLHAAGVRHISGNDGSADWCTVSQVNRFFSHRRDGVSGRQAACIWRV